MGESSLASGFKTGFGSAFMRFTLDRFASLGVFAWREIRVIWGVEDELRKLQRTFFRIQELVDGVEGSPLRVHGGSNAWQLWFEDMRKLAYDADSLLDHVSLHLSTYCAKHSAFCNQENQMLPMVLSSFKELNLPHQISEMQKKLDDLAKEMKALVKNEKAKSGATTTSRRWFNSCSNLVGRANDTMCIADLLKKEGGECNFSVITITGMSGIGKTAVAHNVFDMGDFDLRIWVSVSADFDAVRITKSMIEFATGSAYTVSDLECLQFKLRDVVKDKRLLLVLDDYCSQDFNDWGGLSWPFSSASPGSKIIMTTSNKKVSYVVCSSDTYDLEILSEDDCWQLIRETLRVQPSHEHESIGRQIAKKCEGIPLVAATLGHMLRCKSTTEEWLFILENELRLMPEANSIFLRLLQSYLSLHPHLQKCFAYCSIFPQGYEFNREELIIQWVAEGFIQPIGAQTLEDLASNYFNDLNSRFLFQEYRTTSNQIRYKMPVLILDMAHLVSKDICFRCEHDYLSHYPLFGNSCHLSVVCNSIQPLELKANQKNERLRTFLLLSNAITEVELHPKIFSQLRYLRVLGLANAGLEELVDSIDQVKYLRYLNLSGNPIRNLPRSICKLVALQVLKLRNCLRLRNLDEDISNLINLRHIDLDTKTILRCMPPCLGKLINLQYLSVYIASKNIDCGIGELENLNCLRGTLCIKNIHDVKVSEASRAKLELKKRLEKLELEWISTAARDLDQVEVLKELKPHKDLKELVIRNYCAIDYPNWLSDSCHTLTSIHLKGLKYITYLPSLGEHPFLESFVISDMPSLELIDHTFYGASNGVKFCSLKFFKLKNMPRLTLWEEASAGSSAMPCLEKFTLRRCAVLVSLPQNLDSLLPVSDVRYCPWI